MVWFVSWTVGFPQEGESIFAEHLPARVIVGPGRGHGEKLEDACGPNLRHSIWDPQQDCIVSAGSETLGRFQESVRTIKKAL